MCSSDLWAATLLEKRNVEAAKRVTAERLEIARDEGIEAAMSAYYRTTAENVKGKATVAEIADGLILSPDKWRAAALARWKEVHNASH